MAKKRTFYHGTNNPDEILKSGFNISDTGQFGPGVYLTSDSDASLEWGKYRAKSGANNPTALSANIDVDVLVDLGEWPKDIHEKHHMIKKAIRLREKGKGVIIRGHQEWKDLVIVNNDVAVKSLSPNIPTVRIDTLRKNLMNEMASIVVHGRHPSERFVKIANNIQLSWEDKIYPGGVWSLDVGVRDITKDNPEILKWAKKRWPKDLPSSTRLTKEYVTYLMDKVLPEGANYHIKGQAIQGQNMEGTKFGEGASGARKNDTYFKWWGDKEGVRRLPDGSLLYQADTLGSDVTRPPASGAPSEYIEALSKEDWRKRKRLSPDHDIKNSYGEQWGVPREKWWKVESSGEGGPIEGRLKTKSLAYDNFKSGIRRAGIKGKTLKMSPWEWDAVYQAYKYAQKYGYHVDHIDPISKTGYHVWDNLQVLDANDNLIKSAKTDVEGIIPKRGTYLTQGPLTRQDWEKYTKKNKALEASKIVNQQAPSLDPAINRGIGNRSVGAAGFGAELAPSSGAGWDLAKVGRKAGTLLPFVGAGLDAWDVQQRYQEMMNNPNEGVADWLDKAQFGIASATVGTSFWAEPANFALGIANLGIDTMRTIFEEEKREDFGHMMRGVTRNIGHTAQKLF